MAIYIGIVYLQLQNTFFKVVSIKCGSDGSIYITTPLTGMSKGQVLGNFKFTYHKDGNSWLTTDVETNKLQEIELRKLISGAGGFKNNRLYTKDFGAKIPLDNLTGTVNTRFVISYNDINSINQRKQLLDTALNIKKIKAARIIDGKNYNNLKLEFYLVNRMQLNNSAVEHNSFEKFYFDHPIFNLKVVVVLIDEWVGGKDKNVGNIFI